MSSSSTAGPKCSCTSAESTRLEQADYFKCKSHSGSSTIPSYNCTNCSNKNTYRCGCCLANYQKAVQMYFESAKKSKVHHKIPELVNFLGMDWKNPDLTNPPPFLEVVTVKPPVLKHVGRCAFCYQVTLPKLPPLRLASSFFDTASPKFASEYITQDVPYPHPVTGKIARRPAVIHVVTMHAVLDNCGGDLDQSAYLSRWFQHDHVSTFSTWDDDAPMPNPVPDNLLRIRLVRGLPPKGKVVRNGSIQLPPWEAEAAKNGEAVNYAYCLSFKIFGHFADITAEDAAAFLVDARDSAHIRNVEKYGGTSIRNRKGVANSSYRTNRVGGPFGNANEDDIEAHRDRTQSSSMVGAVPRKRSATMLVPSDPDGSGLVTTLVPFYTAVKGDHVSHPPRNAPASRSFVSEGPRLVRKGISAPSTRTIVQRTTQGRYLCALVLLSLPSNFATSPRECEIEMEVWKYWREWLEGKAADDGADMVVAELKVGSLVLHAPLDGEDTRPCRVMSVKRNRYCVEYENGKTATVPAADLVAISDSTDPNEDVDDNDPRGSEEVVEHKSQVHNVMRDAYNQTKSLTFAIGALSQFTATFDATGGHGDSFGSNPLFAKSSVLETKMELLPSSSKPDTALKLPSNGVPSPAVPGSLAYPMYLGATVCSRSDMELHVLTSVLHAAVAYRRKAPDEGFKGRGGNKKRKRCASGGNGNTQRRLRDKKKQKRFKGRGGNKKRKRCASGGNGNTKRRLRDKKKRKRSIETTRFRGVWDGTTFHPDGGAVLDWNSRYYGGNVTAAAWRRSHPHDPRRLERHWTTER